AVERLSDLRGILARQLKEDLRADRENRGAHLGGILVEELIRGHDTDAELAGFREQHFNAASVRDQVLDFIAVESEERALGASEESVLHDGEDQASERRSLLTQLPFFKIHDYPVALVHRIADREGGMLLTHDVTEVWIGGEGRSLVEDRFPHRRPHRFARLVIAEFEVLADLSIRHVLETGGAERSMREEGGKFDEGE